MQEPMRSLLELQRLDSEMQRLEEEEKANEASLSTDAAVFKNAGIALAETEEHVKRLQMVVDKRNLEMSALEEVILKLEGQKMTLKTNEEYSAMQRQIEGKQGEITAFEDQILAAMEVVELGKNELPGRQKELKEKNQSLERARSRVEEEKERVREEVAKRKAEWEEIASHTDGGAVSQYVRIRDNRKGRGLALLSPDNKCQECFMKVHVQLMNEILSGRLAACPSCSRILYSSA